MNIRFMISAVYSVATLCGSVSELPEKMVQKETFIGPVYRECEEAAEKTDSVKNVILSNLYLPGFDVNSDGVFDEKDTVQINETRRQKQLEAEEAAKKAEEEKKAAEEAARIEAEQAAVTEPAVTEPEVTETEVTEPEVTETEAAEPQPEQTEAVTEPEVTEEPSAPVLPEPKQRNGVDISGWQGKVDFDRLHNDGVEFVMIKAGEGTRVSDTFYEYIEGAKAAGINCGVYWFSKATSYSEAIAEAEACLEVISEYQLEFPVACDYEYTAINNLSNPLRYDKEALTDAILGFLRTIERGGYYSMLYTNADFSTRYLERSRITDEFDIWCAGYNTSGPGLPCGIWQYSEKGRKDGIDILKNNSGYVDLDIAYKDYPEIMKALHINGF
jgi:GH25 family lysozyme M1 (1,4-beta-N-acetylmuramidase)